ncbi:hypothetical protein F5144DRAFT_548237 [Chaetomium tenue]|uniref:Uncharacterized protein n=1 Tax=Chaetomium tenue TaxID=1854479 RepID=A0ACB7PAT9_9PEZI|nr:hypothetical protein F5144DRAFT_548237 [Chaetomium globosum]
MRNEVSGSRAKSTPVYLNLVHKEGRAILCMINLVDRDTLSSDHGHWSNLVAVSCAPALDALEAASRAAPSATCRPLTVCRLNIINPMTTAVVDKLAAERDPQPDEVLTLRLGNADFFSLLGTHNGKGIARMLDDGGGTSDVVTADISRAQVTQSREAREKEAGAPARAA